MCRCTASNHTVWECNLEEFDYQLRQIAALLSPLWDSNEKWLLTVEHCCCLDYLSLDLFGRGGFIPFKDPPLALNSGCAPGPSCDSRSLPVRAHRAPNQTGSSSQKQKKKTLFFKASFTITSISVTNFLPFILPLSAVLETPVLLPKKMELTRENINALLSSGSFKEKTSSTFSRGSTQTSGGRGPGKRKKRVCAALQRWKRHMSRTFATACH